MIKYECPDMCLLSETHITNDIADREIKIAGYRSVRCNSRSNRTGGIVAYVKSNIRIQKMKVFATEINWILSFVTKVNGKNVMIAGVYLSATANKTEVMNQFDRWLDDNYENNSVIICGDFNINMNENTPAANRLTDICDENGLTQLVEKPTRVTQYSSQ